MQKSVIDTLREQNAELVKQVKSLEKECKKLKAKNKSLNQLIFGKVKTKQEVIADYVLENPLKTHKQIARELNCSVSSVNYVTNKFKIGKVNSHRQAKIQNNPEQ